MPRESLLTLLDDAARWGEQAALARPRGLRTERWSYARVRQTAFQLARELEARRISRGDRVVLRAANGPEWVVAFLGCLLRGAVAVPLDPASPPDLVRRIETQVAPKLHLADAALEELIAAAAGRDASPYSAEGIGRRDLVEIVFTSGTTAEPKGVCLTHGNLLANIEPVEEEIRTHPLLARLVHPLRFLSPLPLTHVFGQIASVFVPPLLGAEVFLPRSLRAGETIDTVRRQRISVIVAVPRQLEILRESVERDHRARGRREALERSLSAADGWGLPRRCWAFRDVHRRFGWRFFIFATGGATLDRETEVFWRRLGFVVIQGYGMTETASMVSLNSPFESVRGSIGKPLPGQEVRIDEKGQILVRGEAVSPGYWQDGVRPLTTDGWLATGDIAERDEAGNLYFRGRSKDVIVTAAGQNVYPEDLEAELNRQAEVKASTVITFDGPQGPEPLAVLVLRDENVEAAEVVARANRSLAPHQQMRRWFVWPQPDFPRTPSTQKVKKAVVAEAVKEHLSGRETNRGSLGGLADAIRSVGGEVPARLDPGAALATDLKLDSLGQVELLAALEERYQVEIDESAVTAATTVGDLERMLTKGPAESKVPYPYPERAQRAPLSWIRRLLYVLLALPVTRAMCWARARGRERLSRLRGPALFACNHITMVDHALVLSALPARFRHRLAVAMDGEMLRDWRYPPAGTGWLRGLGSRALYVLVVYVFNVFPLPKKSGFRRSFAFAGARVDQGQSLLVFPEGIRTRDGRLSPFMPGIGLLAANLGLPVVPVRIDGLFELKQRKQYVAWPGRVAVTFGEPVRYERETPAEITKDLERRVADLKG